jgi:hypothetical protein
MISKLMFVGGSLDKMVIPVADGSDSFTAEGTHERYRRTTYVRHDEQNAEVFALAGMKHAEIYDALGIPRRCHCATCLNLRV